MYRLTFVISLFVFSVFPLLITSLCPHAPYCLLQCTVISRHFVAKLRYIRCIMVSFWWTVRIRTVTVKSRPLSEDFFIPVIRLLLGNLPGKPIFPASMLGRYSPRLFRLTSIPLHRHYDIHALHSSKSIYETWKAIFLEHNMILEGVQHISVQFDAQRI